MVLPWSRNGHQLPHVHRLPDPRHPDRLPRDHARTQWFYLGVGMGINCLTSIIFLIPGILIGFHAITLGRKVHGAIAVRLFGAPQKYFDTNPIGRTMNKLGADLGKVDFSLSSTYAWFLDML